MGCDIHAFVEYKSKHDFRHDARWDSFSSDQINLDRNYNLFGYLTNGQVRYDPDMEYGINPRGLPEYPSHEVEEFSDPTNTHSHSWLTYEEFVEILELMRKNEDKDVFVPIQYYAILGVMKALVEVDMKVRFVFWFDS